MPYEVTITPYKEEGSKLDRALASLPEEWGVEVKWRISTRTAPDGGYRRVYTALLPPGAITEVRRALQGFEGGVHVDFCTRIPKRATKKKAKKKRARRENPEVGMVNMRLSPSDALKLIWAVEAMQESGDPVWRKLRGRIAKAIVSAAEENPRLLPEEYLVHRPRRGSQMRRGAEARETWRAATASPLALLRGEHEEEVVPAEKRKRRGTGRRIRVGANPKKKAAKKRGDALRRMMRGT